MRSPPVARRAGHPGLLIALLSFGVLLGWLVLNRPLNAPDEPSHLQAIVQVRNQHMIPAVHFGVLRGAWVALGPPGDPAVNAYARAHGVDADFLLIPYEAAQPPLYYLVAGALAALLPADPAVVLYTGRVVAALFGAGAVYFCWAAVRQLAPQAPAWAVATAGSVALLPQFCFNSTTAGNDSAASCLGAAACYVWARGLRDPRYDPRLLRAGAVTGLAILAKLTAVTLLPGLALVVLFRTFQGPGVATLPKGARDGPGALRAPRLRFYLGRGLRLALGAGLAVAAVAGWWFVRNLVVYGDATGSAAAFAYYHITFHQFNPAKAADVNEFLRSTWESLWGRFGWMNISLPHELYDQAGALTLGCLACSALALGFRAGRPLLRRQVSPAAWQAGLILAVTMLALTASYWQFNLTVAFQAQGRYLFLLLVPLSLALTGGLAWLLPGRRLPRLALAGLLIWLALLNLVGLALLHGPG